MSEDSSQLQLLNVTQQKMSDDIADIKATIKEAAQIMIFLRRDQDELKTKLDKVETAQLTCPARIRAQSYGITAKDFLWIVTFLATIGSLVLTFRK